MSVQYNARINRVVIALIGVLSLLLVVTGCWPFNTNPEASFTVSAISGEAPLTVNFSGILSTDSDGIIEKYEWDFGDGGSGSGKSTSHTYTAAGTFTAVLLVTDDSGGQDTAQKTITVTAPPSDDTGGGAGPTASFTATPLVGASPLTVTFNASASVYAGYDITYYSWDFGDGVTGTGITTTHTYSPSTTNTYHVVLRVIASDNSEDTASKDVTVTVSTGTAPSTAPTASFTTAPSKVTAPQRIKCDPGNSAAATGRTLEEWIWRFGDGTSPQSLPNDQIVTHNYVTDRASEEFTVTLIVIDNEDGMDTERRTVVVENQQPVAGFEIYDLADAGDTAPTGGNWVADDVSFPATDDPDIQTNSATIWIRSQAPTGMQGTTPDPNDGTEDEPIPMTDEPDNYGDADPGGNSDHDLCYDPEGQDWSGDTPYGWPNPAWGIEWYKVNWGDGNTEYIEYYVLPGLLKSHKYTDLSVGNNTLIITVTAIDYLGAETSYSRDITITRTAT